MTALAFDVVVALTGNRLGRFDVPCPLCSAIHSPRRKVLGIWRETENFAGFNCARCEAKGFVRRGTDQRVLTHERLEEIRREAAVRAAAEQAQGLRKSRFLWSCRQPITSGSPPDVYLREARGYSGPIPATLGYLPPRKPGHHHAMIAAFGFATEPEPGVLAIAASAVRAVHLSFLKPNGSDKADIEAPKIIVGKGASGFPIFLAPPNDLLGLVVAEGIENALSIHEATGLGTWAAGCASRLPGLADAVPAWIDAVTVAADPDAHGLSNANELVRALRRRGLRCEMKTVGRAS
jgi:Toprim domain